MKPLHPQVRIVDAGDRTRTLYIVEAYDGDDTVPGFTLPVER